MCRKIIWLFVLALTASSLAAGQDDPVRIKRFDAAVTSHSYNPAHPPPQMPATQPDEAGVTVSDFSCVAEVTGEISEQSSDSRQATVTIKMAAVKITLKLNITEWVDELAPQKIWAHEDGHRDIALLFYHRADAVAGIIGHNWLNRTLTATGPDAATAGKKALTDAARKITDDYMTQVRDKSERVQEAYDRITAHGTNDVDEYDAIQQALAEAQDRRKAQ